MVAGPTVGRGVGARRARGALAGVVPLLIALAVAVAVRVEVAGVDGAQSAPAGLVFGALLLVAAAAHGRIPMRLDRTQLGWGVLGTAILCLPPAVGRLGRAGLDLPLDGAFARWVVIVSFVAVAEEVFLRGALWEAALHWGGEGVALAVTTVAFGLLHVPMYGWDVLLVDLAAGFVLGAVRLAAGSVTAPAFVHVGADLAGWWLR